MDKHLLLTLKELQDLAAAVPAHKFSADTPIKIEVDEHRACLKDLEGQTLSWIKRASVPESHMDAISS